MNESPMDGCEIGEQLERAETEQRMTMPDWRDLLTDVFRRNPGRYSSDQKAAIVGSPGRRSLFKVGGVSIVGAALIAACGSGDEATPTTDSAGSTAPTTGTPVVTEPPADTGAPADTVTSTTGPPTELDRALLRTATSLELAAVAAYQAAIDNATALGITAPVADAAVLFQSHHVEHAAALQGGTEAAGGTPYELANPFLMENVVNPAINALTDETGVVELALMLEIAASQTYTFAAGELSLPELRQTIMSIGGVEARHAAVLRGVLGKPQVPYTFNPVTEAAPKEAFIAAV